MFYGAHNIGGGVDILVIAEHVDVVVKLRSSQTDLLGWLVDVA